jgi:hypothetical protein
VDLPFNVALTPGQLQRAFDGLLISCQAICEADQGSFLVPRCAKRFESQYFTSV